MVKVKFESKIEEIAKEEWPDRFQYILGVGDVVVSLGGKKATITSTRHTKIDEEPVQTCTLGWPVLNEAKGWKSGTFTH